MHVEFHNLPLRILRWLTLVYFSQVKSLLWRSNFFNFIIVLNFLNFILKALIHVHKVSVSIITANVQEVMAFEIKLESYVTKIEDNNYTDK